MNKVVAVVAIGTGTATIAFALKSREALELMHIAADNFLKSFYQQYTGRLVDPSISLQVQEPYRTQFLI